MNVNIVKRRRYTREDGSLVELFSKNYNDFDCVHSYMVSIEPGRTRAKHFHNKKTEAIAIACGQADIIIENPETKERRTIHMSVESREKDYEIVVIPSKIAHAVHNPGKTAAVVIIFSNSYDIADAVPYAFEGV